MEIIKTVAFKLAATTTTKYESPEHGQIQEARPSHLRRNWREAAMADLPVVIMSKTIRFGTR